MFYIKYWESQHGRLVNSKVIKLNSQEKKRKNKYMTKKWENSEKKNLYLKVSLVIQHYTRRKDGLGIEQMDVTNQQKGWGEEQCDNRNVEK